MSNLQMLTGGGGNSLLLRRRMMMQGMGNISPYPDPWVDDGKIWLYCTAVQTESATTILTSTTSFSKMSVDGGDDISPSTTVLFNSIGDHLVKLTLKDPKSIATGGYDQPLSALRISQRIYFPETIETIGSEFAARRTAYLDVYLPKSLKSLSGSSLFSGKTNFPLPIDLPNLTTIGKSCFFQAQISKVINLGSITNLSGSCFHDVVGLTEIHLPSTLTNLDNASIYNCRSLKTVYCNAVTPPSRYNNVFNNCPITTIYVPSESVEAYKTASGWSSFASKIQAIPT